MGRHTLALFSATALAAFCVHAITTEDIEGGGTALVVSGTSFTADEKSALNGNTVDELWKTGSSTLVAEGISSFTGDIRVKAGVYRLDDVSGWGTRAGKVYVTDGGTLYAMAGDANKEVHIAGEGDGTYTALVKNNCSMKLVMDADATVSFIGNWRSLCYTLNMNGHTLTQKWCPDATRSEGVWPKAENITNPGHVVIDGVSPSGRNAALTFLYSSDQLQGTNHTITVRQGHVDWYFSTKRTNWTLILEKDAHVGYGSDSGVSKLTASSVYRWDGPIEVKEGATLNLRPGPHVPVIVSGNIYGAGSVSKNEYSDISVAYLKGTNTYAGTTTVLSGTLLLHNRDAMASSDPSKYSVASRAAVAIRVNGGAIEDGFSSASANEVLSAFGSLPSSSALRFAAAEGTTAEVAYSPSASDKTVSLGSYTNSLFGLGGAVRINGVYTGGSSLGVSTCSDVEFTAPSGSEHVISALGVYLGTATLKDFGRVACDGFNINVGASTTDPMSAPRLILDGDTHLGHDWSIEETSWLYVAGENKYGVLEIRDGASITNRLNYFGNGDTGYGALYQAGGLFLCAARNSNRYDAYWGFNGGHCYVDVSGGKLITRVWLHFGSRNAKSTAAMYISGGEYVAGDPEMQIGWTGTGVVYQTAGRLSTGTGGGWLRVNSNNYCSDGGGMGLLAVADSGVATISNNGIIMAERTNGVAHVALLNGGAIETKILRRATQGGGTNTDVLMPFPEECSGAYPSFVHFNGGILRATNSAKILGERTDSADTRPTDVLVYESGAILDSSNFTMTVNTPLQAPAGSGVASIALHEGAVRSGYLGAPVVTILGDGEGATAVAVFDKDTGTISGIRVTSPGRGYTTAVARLTAGGKTSITNELECTLAQNVSGPLEKRGSGTLVLNAANSYGGRTVLAGGTLRLGVAGALPDGSAVELAGGALDANGMATPTDWRLDFSKFVSNGAALSCPGDLVFPEGSTLTVENVDDEYLAAQSGGFKLLQATGTVTGSPALAGVDSPLWRLVWRGNALCLSSMRGTAIYLK